MTAITGADARETATIGEAESPGVIASAIKKSLRRPSVIIALLWLLFVILTSFFASAVSPYDPLIRI